MEYEELKSQIEALITKKDYKSLRDIYTQIRLNDFDHISFKHLQVLRKMLVDTLEG